MDSQPLSIPCRPGGGAATVDGTEARHRSGYCSHRKRRQIGLHSRLRRDALTAGALPTRQQATSASALAFSRLVPFKYARNAEAGHLWDAFRPGAALRTQAIVDNYKKTYDVIVPVEQAIIIFWTHRRCVTLANHECLRLGCYLRWMSRQMISHSRVDSAQHRHDDATDAARGLFFDRTRPLLTILLCRRPHRHYRHYRRRRRRRRRRLRRPMASRVACLRCM
eukprot:782815-Pleurochrysis_carterae.AAC.1